jgi:hypothetical protein
MFFYPWYPALMLAVESNNVIDMRVRKVTRLPPADARAEINLMVTEKMAAAIETAVIMMAGGTTAAVFSNYRDKVAANALRLTRGE